MTTITARKVRRSTTRMGPENAQQLVFNHGWTRARDWMSAAVVENGYTVMLMTLATAIEPGQRWSRRTTSADARRSWRSRYARCRQNRPFDRAAKRRTTSAARQGPFAKLVLIGDVPRPWEDTSEAGRLPTGFDDLGDSSRQTARSLSRSRRGGRLRHNRRARRLRGRDREMWWRRQEGGRKRIRGIRASRRPTSPTTETNRRAAIVMMARRPIVRRRFCALSAKCSSRAHKSLRELPAWDVHDARRRVQCDLLAFSKANPDCGREKEVA